MSNPNILAERVSALSPAKQTIMGDFGYEHLNRDDLKQVSLHFHTLMLDMCECLPEGRMLSMTATKLWEAKNCAVAGMAQA